jgi:hypothetical protein
MTGGVRSASGAPPDRVRSRRHDDHAPRSRGPRERSGSRMTAAKDGKRALLVTPKTGTPPRQCGCARIPAPNANAGLDAGDRERPPVRQSRDALRGRLAGRGYRFTGSSALARTSATPASMCCRDGACQSCDSSGPASTPALLLSLSSRRQLERSDLFPVGRHSARPGATPTHNFYLRTAHAGNDNRWRRPVLLSCRRGGHPPGTSAYGCWQTWSSSHAAVSGSWRRAWSFGVAEVSPPRTGAAGGRVSQMRRGGRR